MCVIIQFCSCLLHLRKFLCPTPGPSMLNIDIKTSRLAIVCPFLCYSPIPQMRLKTKLCLNLNVYDADIQPERVRVIMRLCDANNLKTTTQRSILFSLIFIIYFYYIFMRLYRKSCDLSMLEVLIIVTQ